MLKVTTSKTPRVSHTHTHTFNTLPIRVYPRQFISNAQSDPFSLKRDFCVFFANQFVTSPTFLEPEHFSHLNP